MKKLFVLFLLVALVPFTVGCGLFGDNDDTSVIVTPAKIKATITIPAAAVPSIREARVAPAVKFAGYTITLGAYTLVVVAEDKNAAGDYTVEFETVNSYAPTVINELKKDNVPMLINNAANATVSVAEVNLSNVAPTSLTITISAAGVITTVSDNAANTAVVDNAVAVTPLADGAVAPAIVSVKNNDVAVAATQAIVKSSAGYYDFVVETNVDFNANVARNFSVAVGQTSVATSHFEVVQAAAGKFVTLRLTQAAVAKLTVNKTYTVVINYLSADGKFIKGGSYSFKTPATL